MDYPKYKVAAAHVSPAFLNTKATVSKACSIISETARTGAQLVVFPEVYIPAFPIWCSLDSPIHNHDLFNLLATESILVPGPEVNEISESARENKIFVSMGLNEISGSGSGTIWNTNILISDEGTLLCHHRKIVPTFYEKLIWAPGDGAGLKVCNTRLGSIGALICGENTNPLARFTLLAQGEQLHMSTYPPIWPTHEPSTGSNYDLKHSILIRAGAHSFEGKVFNVIASGFLDKTSRNMLTSRVDKAGDLLDKSPNGISTVIGPSGKPISDIMQNEEGILYADVDLSLSLELKQFHDVTGGYNRFDIFNLTVNRKRLTPLEFRQDLPDHIDET